MKVKPRILPISKVFESIRKTSFLAAQQNYSNDLFYKSNHQHKIVIIKTLETIRTPAMQLLYLKSICSIWFRHGTATIYLVTKNLLINLGISSIQLYNQEKHTPINQDRSYWFSRSWDLLKIQLNFIQNNKIENKFMKLRNWTSIKCIYTAL